MHDDFKFNLIRFYILKKAEQGPLKLEELQSYLKDKGLAHTTQDMIQAQLEHLHAEDFLSQISARGYKITDKGVQEIKEVKLALEKF